MWKWLILGLVLGGLCLLGKRKSNRKWEKWQEKPMKKKAQDQIRIKGMVTEKNQMNITCYDIKGEQIGYLFATYSLGQLSMEEQETGTVHVEQIMVNKTARRKGVGTALFTYLYHVMQEVEETYFSEFRYVYGEIGTVGGDDPKKSIPFYKNIAKYPYERKTVQFQLREGTGYEKPTQFYFYFSSH